MSFMKTAIEKRTQRQSLSLPHFPRFSLPVFLPPSLVLFFFLLFQQTAPKLVNRTLEMMKRFKPMWSRGFLLFLAVLIDIKCAKLLELSLYYSMSG